MLAIRKYVGAKSDKPGALAKGVSAKA